MVHTVAGRERKRHFCCGGRARQIKRGNGTWGIECQNPMSILATSISPFFPHFLYSHRDFANAPIHFYFFFLLLLKRKRIFFINEFDNNTIFLLPAFAIINSCCCCCCERADEAENLIANWKGVDGGGGLYYRIVMNISSQTNDRN